jgi:hypothetical protein
VKGVEALTKRFRREGAGGGFKLLPTTGSKSHSKSGCARAPSNLRISGG